MTKDTYDTLTKNEKLLYDELAAFAKRLTERMEQLTEVMTKLLEEASR